MDVFGTVEPLVRSREHYQMMYGEDDPEELAILQVQDREAAEQIDSVLWDLYGLETALANPREEEGLDEWIGTVDDLVRLKGIAAALYGKTVDDYQEGRVPAGFQFNHLINHAETDGYYLPVEFLQAFVIEETSIGSAVVLLQELDALEPVLAEQFPAEMATALATPDDTERPDLPGPIGAWHALRRLCRSAVALNLPVRLG